jgi:hypothetical protein
MERWLSCLLLQAGWLMNDVGHIQVGKKMVSTVSKTTIMLNKGCQA